MRTRACRNAVFACLLVVGLVGSAEAQGAQAPVVQKSSSSGFFLDGGVEGVRVITYEPGTSGAYDESGRGIAAIIGYGFSPRWALYGHVSGATIDGAFERYDLGQVDLGARVHFRTGPNTVVPFLQFGVGRRTQKYNYGGETREYGWKALVLGGGIHAHIKPKVAISLGVTWSVGDFDEYKFNNEVMSEVPDVLSLRQKVTSVQIGVIWFPRAPSGQ